MNYADAVLFATHGQPLRRPHWERKTFVYLSHKSGDRRLFIHYGNHGRSSDKRYIPSAVDLEASDWEIKKR